MMPTMKTYISMFIVWICAPVALLTIGSIAYSQEGPPAGTVTIAGIVEAGTGCPPGSVASNVANDRQAFTLLFSQFVASIGPGIPISEARKNCTMNIDLKFPSGWTYTIFTVDYRGFAQLDDKVTGAQTSQYYFQGQPQTATLRTNLVGPRAEDYTIRDTLGLNAVVWSPCGAVRALNINAAVNVNNQNNLTGRGLMTLDTVDGAVVHTYGLIWRRCQPGAT